jgi:NTP pyrophosphatase (non-canonical NTP hydrolase)
MKSVSLAAPLRSDDGIFPLAGAGYKIVEQYCAKFNIPLDPTYAQLKLYEEVGEFTQAVLRHQGLARPEKRSEPETAMTAIAAELTDIIGMAILNAHLLGIDLEEAFARKWFDKLDRSEAAMDP